MDKFAMFIVMRCKFQAWNRALSGMMITPHTYQTYIGGIASKALITIASGRSEVAMLGVLGSLRRVVCLG
jgi:hypothetical protein